jgi:hypothetical protein
MRTIAVVWRADFDNVGTDEIHASEETHELA